MHYSHLTFDILTRIKDIGNLTRVKVLIIGRGHLKFDNARVRARGL